MIFRKPYAFLIKYFKVINLILVFLAIYIVYKNYNIMTFFNNYITQDYSGNFYRGFSNSYISSSLFLILVLIIIGISAIVYLFIYKKKPTKAYVSSIIYYIILLVFFNIVKNVMITLETSVITAELSRIFRDLSLISIIPQVFFISLFLFRALGFSTRKFNFQEDLKELEISENDSEEVEITFKQDGTKLKRTFRRFIREFRYYIKENKFIVIIICFILAIIAGFTIYNSLPEKIDKEYSQGDYFTIDGINYNIEDSIITNLNYRGESLGENNYYIVTRLYIENTTTKDVEIDYNNFRLELNDTYIYPTIDKGIYFIDYAVNYSGNTIKAKSKQLFSLIYKINKDEIKKNYKIKISNGSALSDKLAIGKYTYISITPVEIKEVKTENIVTQGEKISFNNTNLGNSSILLSNTIITNKYIYNYEHCQNDKCNTYKDIINLNYIKKDKILVVLDYEYILDNEVPFYQTSNSINRFIDTFIKIKYLDNEEMKYAEVTNSTPKKLSNKIVLETTNEIENSSEVYVSITIRNKEYLIRIK